jgi:hypothetical protein
MQRWLLLIFLFSAQAVDAQRGMLFIKKRGHKVTTYAEGSYLKIQLKNKTVAQGTIWQVRSDSVFIDRSGYPVASIQAVLLPHQKPGDLLKPFLYSTAFVAFATTAMVVSKWASFKSAIAASAGIGYGRFLITLLPQLHRKKYKIGKKFTIQALDLHF